MELRDATPDDAAAIASIYNHYVANTAISFEEELVSTAEMHQRIADLLGTGLPWLVATVDGQVAGYAYATKWRVRALQSKVPSTWEPSTPAKASEWRSTRTSSSGCVRLASTW